MNLRDSCAISIINPGIILLIPVQKSNPSTIKATLYKNGLIRRDKTIVVYSTANILMRVLGCNFFELLDRNFLFVNGDPFFYELHDFFIPQLVI